MIPFIFVNAFDSSLILLLEVLLYDPNDCLLHFFLHYVIFPRCIDFVQKFLLSLFKCLSSLLLAYIPVSLFLLEISTELVVVFFCQGLHSQGDLLLEIISRVL